MDFDFPGWEDFNDGGGADRRGRLDPFLGQEGTEIVDFDGLALVLHLFDLEFDGGPLLGPEVFGGGEDVTEEVVLDLEAGGLRIEQGEGDRDFAGAGLLDQLFGVAVGVGIALDLGEDGGLVVRRRGG